MKKLALFATLSIAAIGAQAQDAYIGLGAPGVLNIGYAAPMGASSLLGGQWGLRGEFAGGIAMSKSVTEDGNTLTAKINANRLGAYADWFPSENSGFRLVGGLTFNDIKFSLDAQATGSIDINGKTVDLTGQTFKVTIKYPQVAPYVGIGWGHKASTEKGLGFFADVGMSIGKFKTQVDTSLVGATNTGTGGGTITQADVDAQVKDLRDALDKLPVLPSVSVGLVYRF